MRVLGLEIAKNLVLAGCKELLLYDPVRASVCDLSGNFFLESDYQGESESLPSIANKLQQLNHYVKVTVLSGETQLLEHLIANPDLKAMVITEPYVYHSQQSKLYALNSFCRNYKTALIVANQNGTFSRVVTDFGADFIVLDNNGEDMQEVMIQDIAWDAAKSATVVTLLQGFKHKYQDGDVVKIKEVKGMLSKKDAEKSINGSEFKIKVLSPSQFTLDDFQCDADFTPYEGNGTAKQLKVPVKLAFSTLEELDNEAKLDENLAIYDFEKMEHHKYA